MPQNDLVQAKTSKQARRGRQIRLRFQVPPLSRTTRVSSKYHGESRRDQATCHVRCSPSWRRARKQAEKAPALGSNTSSIDAKDLVCGAKSLDCMQMGCHVAPIMLRDMPICTRLRQFSINTWRVSFAQRLFYDHPFL